jgi:hypothetical protein
MEFATYVRKPFTVEAVEVTEDNIEEIAKIIGVLRHNANGKPHIQVNRRIIPNLIQVFPGYWVTKVRDEYGENIRCYSKRIFHNQFIINSPDIEPWLSYLGEESKQINPDETNVPMFTDADD